MNDGTWSKQDDADLKRMMRQGRPLREAAVILQRSLEDVERRLMVLGSRMPGAVPKDLELD